MEVIWCGICCRGSVRWLVLVYVFSVMFVEGVVLVLSCRVMIQVEYVVRGMVLALSRRIVLHGWLEIRVVWKTGGGIVMSVSHMLWSFGGLCSSGGGVLLDIRIFRLVLGGKFFTEIGPEWLVFFGPYFFRYMFLVFSFYFPHVFYSLEYIPCTFRC